MLDPTTVSPIVDFLVVGSQKAGTTALHHMLSQHRGIFMPASKELHFFDKEKITDWAAPDYTNYEIFFQEKQDHQIAGEATPIYAYWPPCAERIYQYNPEMKLILCIRDPADRAFSHWSMETARQSETMAFSEAIRQGRSRVAENLNPLYGHHRVFSYVERGFYARQISRILTHFDAKQLLVLTFDEFQSNLNGCLDTICGFLGAPEFSTYPSNRKILPLEPSKNVGSINRQDRNYLMALYEEDVRQTEGLTGQDLSGWKS